MIAELIALFNDPKKQRDVKIVVKLDSIKEINETFLISFQKDSIEYKGFAIKKGEIFPNPRENNIIEIDKILFKYDDNFKLKLFIHAKIINNPSNYEEKNNIINTPLDFNENSIIPTLKTFFGIEEKLYTNVFIVDSITENEYSIKCMENNKTFILSKDNTLFDIILDKNDIILINDFKFEDIKIILSKISLVEKLTEEKLFFILENFNEIGDKFLWGKLIEIDEKEKNYIIMDKNKDILTMQNLKNNDIKLGQFFLISGYIIDKEKNLVFVNEDSFSYFSSQELYFSDKIYLNKFSVIQFYFLDYNYNNNIFNLIQIKDEKKEIKSNKMNFIVSQKKIKNFEIYIERIVLLKYKEEISNEHEFHASICQGFINKINAFINYESPFSYYYEFIYYSYNDFDFLKTIEIKFNNNSKNIMICDDFCSKNRRKFNVLNIPFQNESNDKECQTIKSKLICLTFTQNPLKPDLFGIFNVKSILMNIPIMKFMNNIYDKYYDIFGNIFDFLKMDTHEDNIMITFINDCINKYNKYRNEIEKLHYFKISIFEENISLSQLKTKIGIIASYYINKLVKPYMSVKAKINAINPLITIAKAIGENEHSLSCEQILRLFLILTKCRIDYRSNPELIFISQLSKDFSPYYSAYKFNLEEIENIDECCKFFLGYLQMDSYILANYNIKSGQSSYSFNIEPLFILKYHLRSNYEDFFVVESQGNDKIAWTDIDYRVTVINEQNLFQRSTEEDVSYIKDKKALKNHAFGISIVFRHEKNSHQKKNLKNGNIRSPFYYCNNGKIKETKYLEEGNILTGEDGILIESLITEDRERIISLTKDFIYGELLDFRLLIVKDFSELNNKIQKIIDNSDNVFVINLKKNQPNSIPPNDINKMEDKTTDDDIKCQELIIQLFKKKHIMLGDQNYSLGLIEDMITLARNNNTYQSLPKFFQDVDKKLRDNSK